MKGEVEVSAMGKLTGKTATQVSFAVVLVGLAIVAFALIGFPLLLG